MHEVELSLKEGCLYMQKGGGVDSDLEFKNKCKVVVSAAFRHAILQSPFPAAI